MGNGNVNQHVERVSAVINAEHLRFHVIVLDRVPVVWAGTGLAGKELGMKHPAAGLACRARFLLSAEQDAQARLAVQGLHADIRVPVEVEDVLDFLGADAAVERFHSPSSGAVPTYTIISS